MLAKLYETKHPKAPFMVVYSDPTRRDKDGRTRRPRKRFSKREDAVNYQTSLNKRLQVVGTSGLVFDHQLRAQALAAQQKLQSAGLNLSIDEVVARFVAEHPVTIGRKLDAIAELESYLEEKRIENRSEKTVADISQRVRRWFASEAIVTLADLTDGAALNLKMRKGVGAKTRVNDLNACGGFCFWAQAAGKLAVNPFAQMPRPQTPRHTPRVWLPAEAQRILRATEDYRAGHWVATVVVMLFAGVRTSELAHARIILQGEPCVRVEGGKMRGRANRIVPLAANAVAWLRRYPAANAKLEPLTKRARAAICRMAKTDWGHDVARHTFISYRIAMVHDEGMVAREAGNSPDIIFKHYFRLRTQAEARAFWGLQPVGKKAKKSI